jgi:hypothetical protein
VISNKKAINLFKLSKNVGEPIHFSSKCGDFIGFFPKSFLDHVIGLFIFFFHKMANFCHKKNH